MFNLPNPGNNPANPFYYRTREEQRRALEEAVTVDIEFKKDADGAAAVGSETGRRGLVVSGKKVRDKVYKMVEGHDFEKDEREHYRMNYQTGLVFFIAGLPAFIACLVLQFL